MQTEQQTKQRLDYLKGYYDGLNEFWSYEEDLNIKAKIEELERILNDTEAIS
jgi:hypothetical protein